MSRVRTLEAIRDRLTRAGRVVLTTHVNPDGDGLGSMVALGSRLRDRGIEVSLVTPTPAPTALEFLLRDLPVFVATDPAARDPLRSAELVAILDTAEKGRLGAVAPFVRAGHGVIIDHHPPVGDPLVEPAIRDPEAAATGELIHDLFMLDGDGLTGGEADALYVAIATDTGSFQFSNTTSRTHEIAARLLEAGVDPAVMYRALHGTFTRTKLALLQHALAGLEVDARVPIAWVAVDHHLLADLGARAEDLEGLVEYPRRLSGIEVGLFFRGLSPDRTKVSLRSNGEADVAEVAQELGGGGHAKAAGAVIEAPLETAVQRTLELLRPVVAEATAG